LGNTEKGGLYVKPPPDSRGKGSYQKQGETLERKPFYELSGWGPKKGGKLVIPCHFSVWKEAEKRRNRGALYQ